MLAKIACVVALAMLAAAAPHREHVEVSEERLMSFEEYQTAFGKTYASTEESAKRAAAFAANLEFIRKHNADSTQTYKVGINQFTDLTNEEYRTMYLRPFKLSRERNFEELDTSAAPSEIDWRTKGAVSPVKNQGQCGSCWSFSATGSMEGAHQIATGTMVVLSEQQLMDCSRAEGDQSCNGGLMDYAFEYVIKNGGLDTEADYPYLAHDETCKTDKEAKHAASISGYKDVPPDSDAALAAAVAIGPVSVAIEADQSGFQMYKSGVFSGPCGVNLDHGVLAVGYTADYWIVKNSWGTVWGDQGYIMMSRSAGGAAGICGIHKVASYPISSAAVAAPDATYYEDPNPNGCQADEDNIEIEGITGNFCSPRCTAVKKCPTEVPAGSTARPECVLEKSGASHPTNCALMCTPGANDQCPTKASCKAIQTVGVCTYDS